MGRIRYTKKIPDRDWLKKINPYALDKGLLFRSFWQRFILSAAARHEHCDVIFVPGGSFIGSFQPIVTMSQNLLPFEQSEFRRYGLSFMRLKLKVLKYIQSRSFKYANGIIFLTEYAKNLVVSIVSPLGEE